MLGGDLIRKATLPENGWHFPPCLGCKTRLSSPVDRATSEQENCDGTNLWEKNMIQPQMERNGGNEQVVEVVMRRGWGLRPKSSPTRGLLGRSHQPNSPRQFLSATPDTSGGKWFGKRIWLEEDLFSIIMVCIPWNINKSWGAALKICLIGEKVHNIMTPPPPLTLTRGGSQNP